MREDMKDIKIISGPIANQLEIRWYNQSGQR